MRHLLAFLLVLPLAAQPDFFEFAIDQDRVTGAPDFSWLNVPIGPEHRVFVRDGHFFRVGADLSPGTADDSRVSFWGVNLAFGANFPSATDAVRVAQRLRRLGVNIVRLHHMDSQPDSNPANAGSLLTTGPYPTLNETAVGRLRAFIDALRAEGIYINLNLHVGYQFRTGVDGLPELPGRFPDQSKPLHMIHPRMIEAQAEYTRKVVEALGLKDNPALAMVEINNESSLAWHWQAGDLHPHLNGEYRDVFQRQWNDFLAARYGSTTELRSAWGTGDKDAGDALGYFWRVEDHNRPRVARRYLFPTRPPELRIYARKAANWIIIKQAGFPLNLDRAYVAELEIRADLPAGTTAPVYWDVKEDGDPWRTYASRTIQISNEWQKFTMAVAPGFAPSGGGRFAVSVENVGATVSLRNWRLYQPGKRGLRDGETLEQRNVSIVSDGEVATEARERDFLLFLAARDRAYLDTMLAAVREKTDALVPVAGTQTDFGGLLNFDSHDGLDYQDHHFYVDHYSFPNRAWDGHDWRLRDESHIRGGLSAFLRAAASRQAGRPYTVSEFNQPWPNSYAAEIDPTMAVFGRFQDWDGIMHFAYSHGRNWDAGVPNGFNLNGDWTKWAGFGQAAWIFRSDAIRPGVEPLRIPVSQTSRLLATAKRYNANIHEFLKQETGYDPNAALVHRVEIVKDGEGPVPEAARMTASSPFASDTGEYIFNKERSTFVLQSPKAAGVFGFIGREKTTAGAMDVELTGSSRGFAALFATALGGQNLGEPGRVLVSNPGQTLRTQPSSSPARRQEYVNYPGAPGWWTLEKEPWNAGPSGDLNGGNAPTWMERVEAIVTIRSSAEKLTVHPLNGKGEPQSPIAAERVPEGFRVHLQAAGQFWSPWFELIFE